MCNVGSERAGCRAWKFTISMIATFKNANFVLHTNSFLFMSKPNFTLMMWLAKQFWSVKPFFYFLCMRLSVYLSISQQVPLFCPSFCPFCPSSFCPFCPSMQMRFSWPVFINYILVFWMLHYVASKRPVGPLRNFLAGFCSWLICLTACVCG